MFAHEKRSLLYRCFDLREAVRENGHAKQRAVRDLSPGLATCHLERQPRHRSRQSLAFDRGPPLADARPVEVTRQRCQHRVNQCADRTQGMIRRYPTHNWETTEKRLGLISSRILTSIPQESRPCMDSRSSRFDRRLMTIDFKGFPSIGSRSKRHLRTDQRFSPILRIRKFNIGRRSLIGRAPPICSDGLVLVVMRSRPIGCRCRSLQEMRGTPTSIERISRQPASS